MGKLPTIVEKCPFFKKFWSFFHQNFWCHKRLHKQHFPKILCSCVIWKWYKSRAPAQKSKMTKKCPFSQVSHFTSLNDVFRPIWPKISASFGQKSKIFEKCLPQFSRFGPKIGHFWVKKSQFFFQKAFQSNLT